jgi:hypothetical protein
MSDPAGDDNLKDDLETVDPQAEIQKAYDTAQKTNWTIARQSAAMLMGVSILNGIWTPELDDLKQKGVYNNALRDIVLVLFLLSRTEAQVIRINARQNIEEAIAEAYLWAELQGIKYGSARYLEGVRTLAEIVGSIYTSFYAVDGKKPEAARKNDSSPPGRSEPLITPSRPAGTTPITSETE